MTTAEPESKSDALSILSFDEDDNYVMEIIAESVAKIVPSVFPETIQLNGKKSSQFEESHELDHESKDQDESNDKSIEAEEQAHNNKDAKEIGATSKDLDATVSIFPVHEMDDDVFEQILDLVDLNLGSYYQKRLGKNWKDEKRDEMEESGLVYVIYTDALTKNIVAFTSVKLVAELAAKVLYLYEIQISSQYQSIGVGSKLISSFHKLATKLNDLVGDAKYKYSTHFSNEGTSLTVFSDNDRALNWYFNLGYTFTDDSPRDKLLRNEKVVKPSFYLLTRPLEQK
ncbi:hypothetical protein QCA50_009276 [Cerrena zonata]|uniref:N-alpha-acetyltransferase 40 n=1 Tax=Cerrena zonata TaxID=2478898 RepID=A0AAW0G2E6_9APHY